ncbi:MAG: MMPL family transporter [Planctomycetes bacterium]|nr:MMPL family transporter [Planctomycetota bacterium]
MSRRARALVWLAGVVTHRPGWVVAVAGALAGASIAIAYAHLDLLADQNALISESQGFHHRYMEFVREFGDLEFAYAVIEAPSREKGMEVADVLAAELRRLPGIRQVVEKFDFRSLGPRALFYLGPEKLGEILKEVEEDDGLLASVARAGSLDALLAAISGAMEREAVGKRSIESAAGGLRALESLLRAFGDALEGRDAPLPSLEVLFGEEESAADRSRQYLFAGEGSLSLVMILPQKDFTTLRVIEGPLRRIRAAIDDVRARFPDVPIGLTGRPVLQADEMATTSRDMKLATIVAFAGVVLLLVLVYRQILAPLLAGLSLALGIVWTFGVATVTVGSLNLLSMVFATTLVGIGIGYGIHFATRFVRVRHTAKDLEETLEETLAGTGKAILTCAGTSAIAFLSALLTHFLGLAQFGLFGGIGLVLCLIAMLVVLPALLSLAERWFGRARYEHMLDHAVFRADLLHRRPYLPLALAAVFTAVGFSGVFGVRFTENLLELQAPDLESVAYEHKIIAASDRSTFYAASVADTYDAARERSRAFAALPTVARAETVEEAMPPGADESLAILEKIGAILERRLAGRTIVPPSLDGLRLQIAGWRARLALFAPLIAAAGAAREAVLAGEVQREVGRVAKLLEGDDATLAPRAAAFQGRLFAGVDEALGAFGKAAAGGVFRPDDLPPDLLRRYRSPRGRYLVYVYPRDDIWDPPKRLAFVREIRSVDPDATGTPIGVEEASLLMRRSFFQMALYATAAILVLVWLDLRRLRDVALALIPVSLGILWLVEMMGILRIDFSLANFFAIPILIGTGVDSGIHLIHAYREKRSAAEAVRSSGVAVILSVATTVVGFGSLNLASHRGLASLGLIMSIGAVACLLSAFLVLGPILALLDRRRIRAGGDPAVEDPRPAETQEVPEEEKQV